MIVKNEEDIIGYTIENLLQQVDKIYLADNGSDDNTLNIASKYKEVEISVADGEYEHAKIINGLIQKCSEFDWVVPVDGDEIWQNIKAVENFKNAHTLKIRFLSHFFPGKPESFIFDPRDFPFYEVRNIFDHPRVVFRPKYQGAYTIVDDGCHHTSCKRPIICDEIKMLHYPIRSMSRYKTKIVKGYESIIARGLDGKIGHHWKRWYEIVKHGYFEKEFMAMVKKDSILM